MENLSSINYPDFANCIIQRKAGEEVYFAYISKADPDHAIFYRFSIQHKGNLIDFDVIHRRNIKQFDYWKAAFFFAFLSLLTAISWR